MTVPSSFTDLSTTPGSNSPAGGDAVFPDLDDFIRFLGAALASIKANTATNGWVSPYFAKSGDAFTGPVGSYAYTTVSSQAFTATPTFNAALSNVFEFSAVMTANVTSCTISNPHAGQTISIRVKQNGTGNFTFAAPSGAKILGSIGLTASAASILTLTYSSMDSRWEGSWTPLPA